MATDLTQLRADLKRSLGNRTELGNDEYDAWINAGYRDFSGRCKITELQRVTAYSSIISPTNTITYTITPTVTLAILDLHDDTNDEQVDWVAFEEFRRYQAQTISRGFVWTSLNKTIYVWPTPSVATVFSGVEQHEPVVLTDPTDAPEVAETYRYGIQLMAQVHAWRDIRDPDRADQILAQFKEWKSEVGLTDLIQRRNVRRRRTVRAKLNIINPRMGV